MKKRCSFEDSTGKKSGLRSFWCFAAVQSPGERCIGLLIIIGSMVLHGCLILPVPTPEHGIFSGRGEITEADVAVLEVGKTTREDVLLRFGEPSASLESQQTFVYHWNTARGYLFAGIILPGPMAPVAEVSGPITKDYLVLIEFDEHDRLRRLERESLGVFSSLTERLDQLSPPGSAKIQDLRIDRKEPAAPSGRGRFIIYPTLVLTEENRRALAKVPPVRIKFEDFVDETGATGLRAIGQKKAAFGVVTHDIYVVPNFTALIRDAIAAQWEAAGHVVVEDNQDVTVSGRVLEFKLETPFSMASWDAVGTLDVIVEVRAKDNDANPFTRRYQSRQVVKTVLGPSKEHVEKVIVASLQDLAHQMGSDADLVRSLTAK